jgi:hypothetical protein
MALLERVRHGPTPPERIMPEGLAVIAWICSRFGGIGGAGADYRPGRGI